MLWLLSRRANILWTGTFRWSPNSKCMLLLKSSLALQFLEISSFLLGLKQYLATLATGGPLCYHDLVPRFHKPALHDPSSTICAWFLAGTLDLTLPTGNASVMCYQFQSDP